MKCLFRVSELAKQDSFPVSTRTRGRDRFDGDARVFSRGYESGRSAQILLSPVTNNAENWKDEEIQRRTHAAAGGAGRVHLAKSFEYTLGCPKRL